MGYKNLQDYMSRLDKQGQLKHIVATVRAELEITEIADRVVKQGGPALLFENVIGSPYPLLIGAFGSYERMAMALGENSLDDVESDITELIDFSKYSKIVEAIKSLPHFSRLMTVFPVKILKGACQEVIEEPDLDTLPILKCWPGDAGRFITMPLVFTKDPETGQQNLGMYRMQVYDSKTTGMHWHIHKDGQEIFEKYRKLGKRMPVSVVIGCDPATIYAATAPLPKSIDELFFAGYLRRRPVPIVKSITNDIYIPANSEFVLEGYVDTTELRVEGPFGDHTGYYSQSDLYPVFHVTKMTHRKKPVFIATIVGRPPMEDCYMGKATERIFLPLLRMTTPEIVDINFPLEGVFHNCVIVSIDKRYPGHGHKVMHALWGMGQMMYTKMIVIVDKTVDPHDISTVAWKVFNNIDPRRDLIISDGPLDALDHSSPMQLFGSKVGVDATKKLPGEGHDRPWPDDIEMDMDTRALVDKRWAEYGF